MAAPPGVSRIPSSNRRLAADLRSNGVDVSTQIKQLDAAESDLRELAPDATEDSKRNLYLRTRWIIRDLVLTNPLLDFDQLLFVRRLPEPHALGVATWW